ncbi:MAG: efflux RND transporter periplasmic adaptor subunit [Alphaproteobacteria bacterium]|nr:efflux RND transporter periplasmic adaptor subunit [Alphaproteobacteria bacterium]
MRKALLAILVLAMVAGGWWWWRNGAMQPAPVAAGPAAPPPVAVEVAAVKTAPLARRLQAVGTLRSNESVVLRPEVAGRVARIEFDEGQAVRQGQLLVSLDDTVAAAEVKEAEAQLALSETNANRAEKLFRQNAGTERSRDEAAAQVRVDRARLEVARAQLAKTRIMAPFDGIVGLRKVSVGAYVLPGADIANLESIQTLKVDFRVPEVFLAAVRPGQTLQVAADAFPKQAFEGRVYAIDPLIDEAGRSILLRARVDNAAGALRPGLFVRVALVVDEVLDALVVPEEALVPRGRETVVFRVVDGKAQPAPVETGRRRDGVVEIVKGVAAGDKVVTAGHMKLRPGAPVAVAQVEGGSR